MQDLTPEILNRAKIALSAILWFCYCTASTAAEVEYLQFDPSTKRLLKEATDILGNAMARPPSTLDEYKRLLGVTCNATKALTEDSAFESIIRQFADNQYDDDQVELREQYEDIRDLFYLIPIEHDLLVQHGYSQDAIEYILGYLIMTRSAADDRNFHIDADRLISGGENVSNKICDLADHVDRRVEQREYALLWTGIGYILSGAALIAVDTAGGVPTGFATVSSVFFGVAAVSYGENLVAGSGVELR